MRRRITVLVLAVFLASVSITIHAAPARDQDTQTFWEVVVDWITGAAEPEPIASTTEDGEDGGGGDEEDDGTGGDGGGIITLPPG